MTINKIKFLLYFISLRKSYYLEFMKVRAGTYTSGTLAVVQFALSPSHYTQVPASLNSLA